MALSVLGLLLIFVSVVCFALILVHAFQRSIGTGFIVLCLPIYNVYYGFSQFEHRRKGLVLAGRRIRNVVEGDLEGPRIQGDLVDSADASGTDVEAK